MTMLEILRTEDTTDEPPHMIRVWSGRLVDPFDMSPEDVYLEDIARGLSMNCRFAGHLPSFYSVAEHSFRGAQRMLADGFTVAYQQAFLLHDAAEAYLLDMPRPIKHRPEMAPYREADDRLHKVIAKRFGVGYSPDVVRAVKAYDAAMYEWEKATIRTAHQRGLHPVQAEEHFLMNARRLGIK